MGTLKSWFWNGYKLYILGFFFQKLCPKRGYFEKQSRIIVIYLNIARIYNSLSSRKLVYKTLKIVDAMF